MKDEQIRILKTMHDATNRMDLTMFAQAVNLESNQVIAQMQELAKEGFLQKSAKGYSLTDKGKNAIKISNNVGWEKSFQFYVGMGLPLGFSAQSLEEFYRLLRQVCSDSIEFHFYREDFQNWINDVLMDSELVKEVAGLKTAELHGEDLRKALLKVIDARYGVGELL